MAEEKCFCHFGGFQVKDAVARASASEAAAAAQEAAAAAAAAEEKAEEAAAYAEEATNMALQNTGFAMVGPIAMGGNKITGLPANEATALADTDAISYGQAKFRFAKTGNGLGEIDLSSVMDLDDLFTNGWFEYWGDSIINDDPRFEKGLVFVQGWDGDGTMRTATQTFYPYYVGVGHLVRQYGFIMEDEEEWWGPWEWVNPQLDVNTEYRLTERWQGNPVYTKLIYLGYLSGNNKSVEAGVNYDKVIDLKVVAYDQEQYCTVLPMFGGGTLAAAAYMMGTKIALSIPQDCSENYAYAVIKYIK